MQPGVHRKMPVENIALFLIDKMPQNAILGVANQGFRETLRFYLKANLTEEEFQKMRFTYFFIPGKDRLADRHIPGVNLKSDEIEKYQGADLWFVFTSWQRTGIFNPNDYAVKSCMDRNAKIVFKKWIDGVLIVHYVDLKEFKEGVSGTAKTDNFLRSVEFKNRTQPPVATQSVKKKQRPWLRREK